MFVSRAGLKLRHALDEFKIDVTGRTCADFGCNVGGFTDCLLQAGAARVYALDTGYGALAWKLRQDPRVIVMERTNALHAPPPPKADRPTLITIDMGWTPQRLCIPAALKWLAPTPDARIITLIKPHYEATGGSEKSNARDKLHKGVLDPADAERIVKQVAASLPALGASVLALTRSPLEGGAGKGNNAGNAEWLAMLVSKERLA